MVFAALQQRHMRERVEMEELFNNEVDSARAFAKAYAEETRQMERDNLMAKQDQVSVHVIFKVYFLIFSTACLTLFYMGILHGGRVGAFFAFSNDDNF